ncbi:MAG: spermine/spermidine synthase domain-containing protein [Deferrisomatales bacterium]
MPWPSADPAPSDLEEKAVSRQPSFFPDERLGAARARAGLVPGLFLLSAGVLCYELLLMRVFSVLMWYHFASLAIGLALLGLGAGGVAVGVSARLRGAAAAPVGAAVFGLGVLMFLGFLVAVRADPELAHSTLAPFHQPFYRPFERPEVLPPGAGVATRLLALSVLCAVPFIGAGVATSSALARSGDRIHRPYAATFLGSAAGCAAAPLALTVLGAPAVLALAAGLGFAGAAVLGRGPGLRAAGWGLAVAAAGAAAWVQVTDAAELPFARGRYEPQMLAVRWNAMSRVAAYPLSAAETSRPFGRSPGYRGPVPRQIGLVVDDSGYTNLFHGAEARENPEYFRSDLVALAYHLRPRARALILGPGGGKDVWIALSFPVTSVRAVEINPTVVDMAEHTFAEFTGRPYSDPRVSLTVTDGRAFAAASRERYDVVEASAVYGRFPPAAGAFTLSEDLLHTVEAFDAYWARLAPDGLLSLSRFVYDQQALRLVSLARALLERQGITDPAAHVRVVSDRGLANVLVRRSPFPPDEDRALTALVERLGFQFLYPAASASALTRLLDEPRLADALAPLPFDVSPPTDDRPFFYYTVRPGDFWVGGVPGRAGFDNRGAQILRSSFGVLLTLTAAGLLAPLVLRWGLPLGSAGVAGTLAFACAVGLGYMALEIGTMKRLGLLLGHPVHAASVTLFAFLLGSGAGSLWSARIAGSRRALVVVLLAAAALGAAQAAAGTAWISPAFDLPAVSRWALAAALILPLAFLLGAAFPAAMALLGPAAAPLLPWAWAVNGAASVAGALGAVLLAMNLGYTATIGTGAGLYLAAAACLGAFPRRGPA